MDLKKYQKKCIDTPIIHEITIEEKIKVLTKSGYDLSLILEKFINESYNSIVQMKKIDDFNKKNNEITKFMKKIKKRRK